MDTIFTITNTTGTDTTFTGGYSFFFEKEVYTPYTSLTITLNSAQIVDSPARIRFWINGKLMHDGPLDVVDFHYYPGRNKIVYRSRSFTALMTQNEFTPGLHTGLTFNSLMDSMLTLPHITHENNTAYNGYIFVKPRTSMWNAVANFCFKAYERYPYINGTNKVCISQKSNPQTFTTVTANTFDYGYNRDFRGVISNFHMEDINGTFNTYNLTNAYAADRNIVRHKHFELDKQFLENPPSALEYRRRLGQKAVYEAICGYYGYLGEDLNDLFTLTGQAVLTNRRVCKIRIKGEPGKFTTTTSAYFDGFNNL